MNLPSAQVWRVAAGVLVYIAAGAAVAQQGFPLRPGDWEVTSKVPALPQPLVQRFCFTSETWLRGLTQNPSCTVQQLSVTSKGIHYALDCAMKTLQMKGLVDMTFDGMEHMTGKSATTATRAGKTTTSEVLTDYRWKGAACTDADVNMRKKDGR